MRLPNDDRLRQFWDKYAPRYDRDMTFFERLQFTGGRQWVCSQASPGSRETNVGVAIDLREGDAQTLPFDDVFDTS